MEQVIDTGDLVAHRDSKPGHNPQTAASVCDGEITLIGVTGVGCISDFRLVKKATSEQRQATLVHMADLPECFQKRWAIGVLAREVADKVSAADSLDVYEPSITIDEVLSAVSPFPLSADPVAPKPFTPPASWDQKAMELADQAYTRGRDSTPSRAVLTAHIHCAIIEGMRFTAATPTPEHVWMNLLDVMASDNDCEFASSTEDFREAKPAIEQLIDAGYFLTGPADLDDDYWMAAAGEVSEAAARFPAEPYAVLSAVLNRVFDGGAQ